MKKTIKLTHPKIKLDRLVDAAKHDLKKFLKKARSKPLPADMIYWDFECKFGGSEETASSIHLSEIGKHIEEAAKSGLESCYMEITPIPNNGVRTADSTE